MKLLYLLTVVEPINFQKNRFKRASQWGLMNNSLFHFLNQISILLLQSCQILTLSLNFLISEKISLFDCFCINHVPKCFSFSCSVHFPLPREMLHAPQSWVTMFLCSLIWSSTLRKQHGRVVTASDLTVPDSFRNACGLTKLKRLLLRGNWHCYAKRVFFEERSVMFTFQNRRSFHDQMIT